MTLPIEMLASVYPPTWTDVESTPRMGQLYRCPGQIHASHTSDEVTLSFERVVQLPMRTVTDKSP